MPINEDELLKDDSQFSVAVVAVGHMTTFSLHETWPAAVAYLACDDSEYVPKRLVDLNSGESRKVVADVKYRLADEFELSPATSDVGL